VVRGLGDSTLGEDLKYVGPRRTQVWMRGLKHWQVRTVNAQGLPDSAPPPRRAFTDCLPAHMVLLRFELIALDTGYGQNGYSNCAQDPRVGLCWKRTNAVTSRRKSSVEIAELIVVDVHLFPRRCAPPVVNAAFPNSMEIVAGGR